MEKFLTLVIALQTRVAGLRDEKGQGTLEYVGMIIVAAIVAVAVLEVTGAVDLGGTFQSQIDKVKGYGF